MTIENLKYEDLSDYKSLIDICFDGSNNLEEYQKNYDEKTSDYMIIVAKENNKIVSSITAYKMHLFTFSFQPTIEIFNVVTDPDYRGKHIAEEIFEYIFNYAKANGFKKIDLTCLDTATSAHKLYERVGFKRQSSVKYSKVI